MQRILVVLDHYFPGYKAGGPIRTIANMVERLGDEFEFYIVTSDRDLGDKIPYTNIALGSWRQMGKAQICYLPRSEMKFFHWHSFLVANQYDIIYLNSFFSRLSIQTIILRRMGLIPKRPVILAPRGEFSRGALSLKIFKKQLYIFLVKGLGLYDGVIWQASSEYEMKDIVEVWDKRATSEGSTIEVAPDLPSPPPQDMEIKKRTIKQVGSARVVFLSRLARKKNLDYAIELLMKIDGNVAFDIYGPIEDEAYWEGCQRLIKLLPDNIKVNYCGIVSPDDVMHLFSRYHMFLFPTLGENFGHVILEALNAGCPVLTSDQTPWNQLATKQAGWTFPLIEPEQFRRALKELVAMDQTAFSQMSNRARDLARDFSENPKLIQANRDLFLKAMYRGQ